MSLSMIIVKSETNWICIIWSCPPLFYLKHWLLMI